ncbi:MAG: hypothetical protein DMG13_25410 [Acidobacteria bacterium]|nr:MAG: hypothetical protein DMG13_25410 [Acidobacteriota bacterium]
MLFEADDRGANAFVIGNIGQAPRKPFELFSAPPVQQRNDVGIEDNQRPDSPGYGYAYASSPLNPLDARSRDAASQSQEKPILVTKFMTQSREFCQVNIIRPAGGGLLHFDHEQVFTRFHDGAR